MASTVSGLTPVDASISSSDSTTNACPPPSTSSAIVETQAKQVQRERERRSRLNRRKKFEKLEAKVASLERMVLALRVIPDADAVWDEFLDDDTKRTRAHLQRFITVSNEVKRITSEKAQLQRLLTERELARRVLARKVEGFVAADKWGRSCERWKALTKIHFQPLTTSECVELMNESISQMVEYLGHKNRQSSGFTFMGWQESHRPSDTSHQFSLHKTYRGYDLNHHIKMAWRVYTEAALHSRVILGGRGRLSMDIVQKISPTAWVIRIAMILDETDVTVHDILLLFRVQTDNGAIQCARSLEATDLEKAIETPRDLWMHNNTWIRWEVLDPSKDWSSTDYRMSVGGFLHVDHPANRSFLELVALVVRSENFIAGRPMLEFSW